MLMSFSPPEGGFTGSSSMRSSSIVMLKFLSTIIAVASKSIDGLRVPFSKFPSGFVDLSLNVMVNVWVSFDTLPFAVCSVAIPSTSPLK